MASDKAPGQGTALINQLYSDGVSVFDIASECRLALYTVTLELARADRDIVERLVATCEQRADQNPSDLSYRIAAAYLRQALEE